MKWLWRCLLVSLTLFGHPSRVIVISEGSGVSPSNPYGHLPLGSNGPHLVEGLDAAGQRSAAAFVAQLFPEEKVAWLAAYQGSNRAIETLLPLANTHFPKEAATDVYLYTSPLIRQYTPQELSQLKKDLVETKEGNVIICWKQEEMDVIKHHLEALQVLYFEFK